MAITTFSNMLGKVMTSVTREECKSGYNIGNEQMVFVAEDGSKFIFVHDQDCCESVDIEDICGDLSDLVGVPLLVAEEVDNIIDESMLDEGTWTFYRYETCKGVVTVRWLELSNGYYSESVSYEEYLV
jgi:hypothetical protein